jgi:environmental stress-induced protein Ves
MALNVQIELIAKAMQPHSVWAGGETRQLAIYPAQATLAARDFQYRISSALVQQAGFFSDFTGYWRHLALLDGDQMQLDIGKHRFCLKSSAYQVQFAGHEPCYATLLPRACEAAVNGANTASVNSIDVIDFNVIVKAPWQARLHRIDHDTFIPWPAASTQTATTATRSHGLFYSLAPFCLRFAPQHAPAQDDKPQHVSLKQLSPRQWQAAAGDAILIQFDAACLSLPASTISQDDCFAHDLRHELPHDLPPGSLQVCPNTAPASNPCAKTSDNDAVARRHPVYWVELGQQQADA